MVRVTIGCPNLYLVQQLLPRALDLNFFAKTLTNNDDTIAVEGEGAFRLPQRTTDTRLHDSPTRGLLLGVPVPRRPLRHP